MKGFNSSVVGPYFTQNFTQSELMSFLDPENLSDLKGLVAELAIRRCVTPLKDKDVREEYQHLVAPWREICHVELGWKGIAVVEVMKGFTLKVHAPKAGPCYRNFEYLQSWRPLKNDEPTKKALVFGPPKIVPGSVDKSTTDQLELLACIRKKYGLPEHHLSNFGSAALNSALILGHFKRTGDRVPENGFWTRTDTMDALGDQLNLRFDEDGLCCANWHWRDLTQGNLGCFALGVEELEN